MPLTNFTLRTAEDCTDRKLLADVAEFGWHVIHVSADDKGPGFSFTVGLFYSFGHPELLIMGLPQNVSHGILSGAVDEIRRGMVFHAEACSKALLSAHSCRFSHIPVGRYEDFLGYAIWFYRSLPSRFPALQILWLEKKGLFPGDDDYDASYFELQIVL